MLEWSDANGDVGDRLLLRLRNLLRGYFEQRNEVKYWFTLRVRYSR
jgi:hypothetical protein